MSATDQRLVHDAAASQDQLANLRRAASGLEEEHGYQRPVELLYQGGGDDDNQGSGEEKDQQEDAGAPKANQVAAESNESDKDKIVAPGACERTASCLKILFMVVLLLYLWFSSAESRLDELALAKTLAVRHQIPQGNVTNEKRQKQLAARNATVSNAMVKYTKGTRYEYIVKGHDGTYINKEGKNVTVESRAEETQKPVLMATKELLLKELGDKTFVIIFLFTLGWSNPTGTPPGYRVAADGRMEIHHRLTHVGPVRTWMLATAGTVYMDLRLTGETTPGKEDRWVFTSAIILVYCLLNYAFRIMSAHFAIVTELEAEYEALRGDEAVTRSQQIRDWAQQEIHNSRDFNEEHMESVFEAYEKENPGAKDNLDKADGSAPLFTPAKDDAATAERMTKLQEAEGAGQAAPTNESVPPGDKREQDRRERDSRAEARQQQMAENEAKWETFQRYLQEQNIEITFDPKKYKQTQLLTNASDLDPKAANKVIWPKKYPNIPKEMERYDVLTGDTLRILWDKISKQICIGSNEDQQNEENKDDKAGIKEPLLPEDQKNEDDSNEGVDQDGKDKKDPKDKQEEDADMAKLDEMIDDVEQAILNLVGKNIIGQLIAFALSLLRVAMGDLLVILFFASQELMDSSNIHILNMKPIYPGPSIKMSILLSKVVMHTVLITFVYYFSKHCFNVYEGHAIGVAVIFFICAYEFMFNVLFNLGGILGLQSLDENNSYWGE